MVPFEQVRVWLMDKATPRPPVLMPLAHAGYRVLAQPVILPRLPPYPVAAIDGLAIRAAATEGASDYAPVPVTGRPIIAGMPVPDGMDSVLPPFAFDDGPVALATVAAGTFVIPAGHDAPSGTSLPAGTRLLPLHLVLLAQAGIDEVSVVGRPNVFIRSPSQSEPGGLCAMLETLAHAEAALVTFDRDRTATAGEPDLILMLDRNRAITSNSPPEFGIIHNPGGAYGPAPGVILPADPLRCLTLFTLLVAPAIRRMGGHPDTALLPATLARKITSSLGELDAVPIRLETGLAIPLGPADGCSLLITSTANGLLLVPENCEGYAEGAMVQIIPFHIIPFP